MQISQALKAVIVNVRARTQDEVLGKIEDLLRDRAGLKKSQAFCDLQGRETSEGPLAGTGSSVIHCLSEEVSEMLVAVATSRKGVAIPRRKRVVRIVFLVVSPIRESGSHLQAVARIETLIHDPGFRLALLSAVSEQDIQKALTWAEGTRRVLYMPLTKERVFSELGTSPEGLSEAEAKKRLQLAGPNTLRDLRKGTLLKSLVDNLFFNLFALLLWAGGLMAFVAGMPQLGWAIFLVIIINAAFSFWQEHKAERAVEALLRLLPKKARVLREAGDKEVDAIELVPGDLIKLTEGDSIPADGRLIEAEELRVDNSALTGESKPVYKIAEPLENGRGFLWTEIPNLVFAGTTVVSGSGRLVVTATGMDTEIGRVADFTQSITTEKSPLQREIVRLTRTVTFIAVSLGIMFFLLGHRLAGLSFAESFLFAIGIIVANVPEGLLPTVSLSLAMGVQRMARKKAIVKKLSAVETLGSATVICTDKTGTLTTNEMCVRHLFANGKTIDVTGTGYSPEGTFLLEGKDLSEEELQGNGITPLLVSLALCNNASLHPPSKTLPVWTISGDPTEAALLTAAAKAGLSLEDLKSSFKRAAHLPFERIRKRMSTVHDRPDRAEGKPGRSAFMKGAPQEVVALCNSLWLNGKEERLTDELKGRILQENDRLAARGLRVLAAASKSVPNRESYTVGEVEKDMTFLGLVAMLDPPKPGVKEAVAECKTAGIRVIVITGDHGLTARAVADETGIAPGGGIITGEDLNLLSQTQLREIVRGEVIFARVAPPDKLRVVTALQDNGEVVAVTGDGVNDAPALKKADIGVAMGLRGSDVAKEAAEIILSDDRFATIVDAVREGRAVYANIKKFVTYILASNIPEIVPFIAFVIFRIPLPLTVMQILAIDLGTDIFPALGLGVEPPEPRIMQEPPRRRKKRLLDFKTLARAYLFLGPLEAALSLSGFFFVYWARGWPQSGPLPATGTVYLAATTMSFAGIVAAQMGNVFACRTGRESVFRVGFFKNKLVLAGIGIELALLFLLIHTPWLKDVFGFMPLKPGEWAYLSFFPIVIFAADELRKAAVRRWPKDPYGRRFSATP